MAQLLFLADSESIKMLMLDTKEERLSYIDSMECEITKESLIKQYNLMWGNHSNDHVRNYFSFLGQMSMDDTLSLYDRLTNNLRSDMIYAIGFDHKHLHGMIEVHSYFTDADMGE